MTNDKLQFTRIPGGLSVRAVIKAKDRPEFTDNDYWRNEIAYLKSLMHKHREHARKFAVEMLLTDTTSKV